MKFEKQFIGSLEKCYALSRLRWRGRDCLLAAAEKQNPCYVFDYDGRRLDTVWSGPGGVMTMVPVPDRDGLFMATQKFYSPNDSKEAYLITAQATEQGWKLHKCCDIPFIHRFSILNRGGVNYVIACTLKSGHEYKDDWRFPGAVFAGVLPEHPELEELALKPVQTGLSHNHGFTLYPCSGYNAAVISSSQGVFLYHPPVSAGASWTIEQLTEQEASDACLIDLDGDGQPELFTISPFHGDRMSVWRLLDGRYVKVWDYPERLPFLHAIDCGVIYEKPVVICGNREGRMELLAITYDEKSGSYGAQIIDSGRGPANCLLFQRHGHPAILSSNRETDEIAIYDVLPD